MELNLQPSLRQRLVQRLANQSLITILLVLAAIIAYSASSNGIVLLSLFFIALYNAYVFFRALIEMSDIIKERKEGRDV